ncbi:hypothetical protein ACFXGI_27230 [Streptomyces sp. NPDC059355]|uniref:hypothetical protein n=1 Tax=Streptomyces sp. NPDC059355 TaxID=3346811 RepID=UPI0036C31F91
MLSFGRSWWMRRKRLALGPDGTAAREALATTRVLFEEVTSRGGCTAEWFLEKERREAFRTVRDLAERRGDVKLRTAMRHVAASGDDAFAAAPPTRMYIGSSDQAEALQERAQEAEDQQRFQRQVDSCNMGLKSIEEALTRLNDLERRATGHS